MEVKEASNMCHEGFEHSRRELSEFGQCQYVAFSGFLCKQGDFLTFDVAHDSSGVSEKSLGLSRELRGSVERAKASGCHGKKMFGTLELLYLLEEGSDL